MHRRIRRTARGPTINRSDRDAPLKYDRSRTRARKEDAEACGAHLIAQLEEQLAKEFAFDEDATWKAAHEDASAAVEAARRAIAERCEQRRHPEVGPAGAQRAPGGNAARTPPSAAARSCARWLRAEHPR
jgi:hypothetical protein